MLIRTGFEMIFRVPNSAPMILMLSPRPERDSSIRRNGGLRLEPDVPVQEYIDVFGNRCHRLVAPKGVLKIWDDLVVEDSGEPDPVIPDAKQTPLSELPSDVIPFLLSSRYCEVDRLSDIAWNLFGATPEGWPRVQAVCDWVHNHITFGYQFARSTKTAYDVYQERTGVCRDFNHLALTFCRCLNIPARYATGYLGDIGIPPVDIPMDFHGWFEAFLDGRWHTFDARHNCPRIGRILMANGRDGVDAALTTAFGTAILERFIVWTDEVGEEALRQPARPNTQGEWRDTTEA